MIAKSANQEGIRVTASPLIKTTCSFPSQWDCWLKSIAHYTAQSARLLSAFLFFFHGVKLLLGKKSLEQSVPRSKRTERIIQTKQSVGLSLLPLQNTCEFYLLNSLAQRSDHSPSSKLCSDFFPNKSIENTFPNRKKKKRWGKKYQLLNISH